MKIGFTGTQRGMTDEQMKAFVSIVHRLYNTGPIKEFHHGDCIGADYQAHNIVAQYDVKLVVHPPDNDTKRAFCHLGNYIVLPPKPYLDRNHDIVDDTHILIATPKEAEEVLRSGTWATMRYASKRLRDVTVIYPDGSVERYPIEEDPRDPQD